MTPPPEPPKPITHECQCKGDDHQIDQAVGNVTAALDGGDNVRWLAMLLRRGLLVIVKGVETRYGIDERKDRAA